MFVCSSMHEIWYIYSAWLIRYSVPVWIRQAPLEITTTQSFLIWETFFFNSFRIYNKIWTISARWFFCFYQHFYNLLVNVFLICKQTYAESWHNFQIKKDLNLNFKIYLDRGIIDFCQNPTHIFTNLYLIDAFKVIMQENLFQRCTQYASFVLQCTVTGR